MASKVQDFLAEAHARGGRKRPAPSSSSGQGATKQQLFLPVFLHLDHGAKEAREQLLWKLGDTRAVPAVVARAFCQQHIQQPQQLDREALRLQKDLEKLIDQHKDLLAAPTTPTLVKLDVRVTLTHLECLFYDEPLWDLSAPRAACEAYIAALCGDLGLDWHAHTLIMRRMKDAIDAASKDLAAGKAAQVVPIPRGSALLRSPPSKLPHLVRMTEQQRQQLREQLAAQAAKRGDGAQQPFSPGLPSPRMAAAAAAAAATTIDLTLENAADAKLPASVAILPAQPAAAPAAAPPPASAPAPVAAATSLEVAAPAPPPAGPEDTEDQQRQQHSHGQEEQQQTVNAETQDSPAPPPPLQQPQSSEQTSGQDMPDLPE